MDALRFSVGPVPLLAARRLLALLACLAAGCTGMRGTLSTVPPEWRKVNSWGPEALQARARGELKPLYYTAEMASWAEFARTHLQEGDILFREGIRSRPRDVVLDRVLKVTSDTPFTHDGIVIHKGEEVWICDVEPDPEGVRKVPFEFWNLDTAPGTLAVMRLREPYRHCIPQALAYCDQAWLRQPHFDSTLKLDDRRLYCNEMIEKAYRVAGITLSEPVTVRCLPRYHRYSYLGPLVQALSDFRVDEPVFSLGNLSFGTFASPYLELVYGGAPGDHRRTPNCPAVPYRYPPEETGGQSP